jgi:NADH/NAD ratio-sensing transcriptional regulator Rex
VTSAGRRCYHVDHLETVLREFDVHMAILASRPEGLQTLVDRVCGAGVHAVLNFVPKRVSVPSGCYVEETDITSKLEMLSFLGHTDADAAQASSLAPGEPAEGMTA